MSISLRLLFVLGAVMAPCIIHAQVPAPATLPHSPIPPAKLEDILSCLPAAPQNWKLTESICHNTFTRWQESVVSRRYVEILPPPLEGQQPQTPATAWVVITDTGYWPSFNSVFLDPKSGTAEGQERDVFDGYPMIRTKVTVDQKDANHNILLWVKQRFLVSVTTSRQGIDSDKKWAHLIDIKSLLQISDDGPKQLPAPVLMRTIDELNPANSSSGYLYWHDPDREPLRKY